MVDTWAVVIGLAFIGFVLLMAELFVIPGFGITGVLALVAIIGSVWYASQALGLLEAAIVFGVMLVLSIYAVVRATSGGHMTRLKNVAVSPGKSFDEGPHQPMPAPGARGVALTSLHPAGIIRIDGARYDVIVDGPIVDAGTQVEVIETIGNVIKVRPV